MSDGLRLRVVFFKTEHGREPVRDWIKSLSRQDQKMIGSDILTVQYGWPVGMPLVRKLEENLWEVRSTGSIRCKTQDSICRTMSERVGVSPGGRSLSF